MDYNKKVGLLFMREGEFKLINYTDDEIGLLYEMVDLNGPSEVLPYLKKIGIRYPSLD